MIARLSRIRAFLRHLGADRQGATLVEFAFVGPVLILMIIGLFDIAHTQYTSSLLHGAMQKAGRDLTLENANSRQSAVDARVRSQIAAVMPNTAEVTVERLSHFDFSDIGEPEEYDDLNGNGTCDNNEPYVESNGVGGWQADRGKDGIGGARDAVLYTTRVTYPRIFPLYGMIGLPQTVTLEASTVLRNQPFDEQADRMAIQRNCT